MTARILGIFILSSLLIIEMKCIAKAFVSRRDYMISRRTLRHVPRPMVSPQLGSIGCARKMLPIKANHVESKSGDPVLFFATNLVSSPVDESISKRKAILFSQLLALNSGLMNGIFLSGIMGRTQAVGPVTDSWTKLGLAFGKGNTANIIFLAGVLCSYGIGALLVGLTNPDQRLFDLKQRRTPLLMAAAVLGSATLLVARAAESGVIPISSFFLVPMANGMQNSFTSTLTQNWCRTTHMTGTTTDLCTFIGQILRGNTKNQFKIPIYGGCVAMFALGGVLAATLCTTLYRVACALAASTGLYFLSVVGPIIWKKVVRFTSS